MKKNFGRTEFGNDIDKNEKKKTREISGIVNKLYLYVWKNLLRVSPGNFLRQSFNKASFQISRQKSIREYLVQKMKMLNQLLGTWEES